MRFFGGFGGWLRVSDRYSARGWRNGQGQTAYNATIKTLEAIRDGKIHIGIATLDKPPQPEPGAYHVRVRDKMDLGGY